MESEGDSLYFGFYWRKEGIMNSANEVISRHPVDIFYNFGSLSSCQKGKNEVDNHIRKSSVIPK